jgi:hypothetical protein
MEKFEVKTVGKITSDSKRMFIEEPINNYV